MFRKISGTLFLWKQSLSSRLSWSTTLVSIFSILFVGLVLIIIANNALQENVIRLQKKTADTISAHISSYITLAINDLQMADIFDITESGDIFKQKKILDNLIIYKGTLFSQLALIDMKGNEKIRVSRYHTYLDSELSNISKTALFETALKGETYISSVFVSPESGLLSLQIAMRIKHGSIFYILMSEINMTKLWQEISSIKIGTTGYAYLVDNHGRYIASHSPADVLRNYGTDVSSISPVKAFINNHSEAKLNIQSYKGYEGKSVIGVFTPIRNTNWAVIVELPTSEAYEGVIRMLFSLIGFMLLGSAAAGFAGYYISKRIVRSMNELTTATINIGKGDLDVEIPGQQLEDEVGVLARTISHMQGELKESYRELRFQLSELKTAQKALSDSEKTVKAIFDNVYQFIGLINTKGILLDANQAALEFENINKADVIGKPFWEGPWWRHSPELQEKLRSEIEKAANGEFVRFETTHKDYSGKTHFIDFSIKPVFDDDNNVIMLIPEGRDITERIEAEEEKVKLGEHLRQAQKMESIATLAGGIAHDFNNVLGGIVGTVSLLKYNFEKNKEPDRKFLQNMIQVIENSADRAKNIVKQLLTISRKQDYQLIPVDINLSVENVVKLCNNSFDKSIEIICNYYEGVAIVNADPSQIEQVILNICINSAHAMTIMRNKDEHMGGVLTISVRCITTDKHFFDMHPEAKFSRYIKITISDTGVGMNKETTGKIFDPFFTTKDKENGNGLGLSMAYSIIHEHNGFIDLYSEPGRGTTFDIYLPYMDQEINLITGHNDEKIYHGSGLILIVDDEEVMRHVASEILKECGYEVLAVENGAKGLQILHEAGVRISLILLDMAMPGMSGKETFIEIKKINPDIKVILSSGFKHDIRVTESIELGVNAFIQKPYSIYNLSKAVYMILNNKDEQSSF